MESLNIKNYQGVKLGKQQTDFVAGVSSPLVTEINNVPGDWRDYKPEHELQNRGEETYACSLFSGLDCVETLFQYMLANGHIPPSHVKFLQSDGYIKHGFINFSDRFPAQFAGIEIGVGTYLWMANNAIRHNICPEDKLPWQKDYYNFQENASLREISDKFKKYFTINWQWVDNSKEFIHKSPLQAVVRFANGSGILKPTGAFNHAIAVMNEADDYYDINDSYQQEEKKYAKTAVGSFVGYTITINNQDMDTSDFIKKNDLKFVRNTNTGEFGRIMQGKLRTITTEDRATLLLFDNEHRKNGVSISNNEWKQLPKDNF
jgi:hypothetical protein